MEEFIDFCILSGCDYLPTIPKLGPATALKLIKIHKNIETVLEVLKEENEEMLRESNNEKIKYAIPQEFDFVTT